jgi:hypothetical protein
VIITGEAATSVARYHLELTVCQTPQDLVSTRVDHVEHAFE